MMIPSRFWGLIFVIDGVFLLMTRTLASLDLSAWAWDQIGILIKTVRRGPLESPNQRQSHLYVIMEDLHPDRPETTFDRGEQDHLAHLVCVLHTKISVKAQSNTVGFSTLLPPLVPVAVSRVTWHTIQSSEFESAACFSLKVLAQSLNDSRRGIAVVLEGSGCVISVWPEILIKIDIGIPFDGIAVWTGQQKVVPVSFACRLVALWLYVLDIHPGVQTNLAIRAIVTNPANQVVTRISIMLECQRIARGIKRGLISVYGSHQCCFPFIPAAMRSQFRNAW